MRRRFAVILTAAMFGIPGPGLALEASGVTDSAGSSADSPAVTGTPVEDPRVGYFVSETGDAGFVLDRTGEKALLRFDRSTEILVLDMVPGPQGVTYLKDRLGTSILRLTLWGGATVYDAEGREGGAFGFQELANPLKIETYGSGHAKRRAAEISRDLGSHAGFAVTFQFDPQPKQPETRELNAATTENQMATLALAPAMGLSKMTSSIPPSRSAPASFGTRVDTLEVTGLALARLAADELALEVMSDKIAHVTIRAGTRAGIALEKDVLVVTYVPERGLHGRPSSVEIERFLLDNL